MEVIKAFIIPVIFIVSVFIVGILFEATRTKDK